ncbi:hypothetical protein C8R47DRAFT_479158 [Mycena vitilis]|nr:hypothetical protein C8R47DRAFT_479158 [Mycena vitilis]
MSDGYATAPACNPPYGPFQGVLPVHANFRTGDVTAYPAPPELCSFRNEVHATATWPEACTRLRETPCGWDGCCVILNSFQTLAWHLHACHFQEYTDLKDSSPMTLSRCLWGGCGESFENRMYCLEHVAERHVFGALCCEYQSLNTGQGPSELVGHHVHDKNTLRPSIYPYTPHKAMRIPLLPAKIQKINWWELSCPAVSVDPSFTGNAIRMSAHIMCSEAPRRPYEESSPVTAELTEGMSDLTDVTKLIVQGKLLLWPRGTVDAQQQ